MKTFQYLTVVSLLLLFTACGADRTTEESAYTAFVGGTVIDGSGAAPISDGVVLMHGGRIVAVGSRDQVTLPENTKIRDVTGKTVIPGLINTHGHVGDVKGVEGGHYSAENAAHDLERYAQYGITTVVSLGGDRKEAVPMRFVNDTTANQRARLYIAGEVINGNTPEEAVAVVDSNHRMGVDFMKIRVDDNLGTSKKMPAEIYQAVIDRSHELGYQLAVHTYYLDDAKKLLQSGADLVAHSIRDQQVDDTLIDLMKARNACYCPTLTREVSTYVYEDTAAFFDDPFFLRVYSREEIQPLLDPERQQQVRNSISAQTYKRQLPVAMANMKILSDRGVPIIMGTDSGMPARFIGYFEHMEMQLMAEAGMTPMEIIQSATGNAIPCMKLKDIGLLKPGYWADLVVLDGNPLDDIRNLQQIAEVWIGGAQVVQ
ncbi:amidohydrolase family protein [Parapedobacter lycopersici]|uniref:amidohydrolase family protein n=1 Tax=Parapedobacter lycopersici TaxID=1864939 RepID=UPI00214D7993|nr:amidohydrolase family protein [Parapedobacter lycopersici]